MPPDERELEFTCIECHQPSDISPLKARKQEIYNGLTHWKSDFTAAAPAWIEIDSNPVTRESINLDPWPICLKPDNIVLVVAGGGHPTHSYWLQAHSPSVIGRVIRLPETFNELLIQADRDLGCASDHCAIA